MVEMCIYQILLNNKVYIGSTRNFSKRKARHLNDLQKGTHHNVYMQRLFNKYRDNPIFSILETISQESNLFIREQHWIDTIQPNLNIGSVGGGDNISNHPNKQDIVSRREATRRKTLDTLGVEGRRELYGKFGQNNANWKGGHKYFCSCGTKIQKEAVTCTICRDRNGENNPFFGKNHSQDTKNLLSTLAKERYSDPNFVHKQAKIVQTPKGIFNSLSAAAKSYGITAGAMHYRVNSIAVKWEEYFYINA